MPPSQATARRRLAEQGLLGRRRQRGKLSEPEWVRLRAALEGLGPLFACFGRYLGSRIDLLPVAACATLADTSVQDPADRAADQRPPVSGIDLEATPFRTSLLHLWNRGTLDSGEAVVVKSVRAGLVEALEDQIEELPVLERLRLEDQPDIGAAVEDYLVWLERQFDLRRELRGLRRLAIEAPNFDALFVPRLWEEHSNRDILVFSDPGGAALDRSYGLANDDERGDRARRLCSSWLQQALLEKVIPEGPPEANLRFLDDGRIAVTGGLFGGLGRSSRRALLDSLVATSRDDPDRACEHLLTACNSDLESPDHDRLRVLFRQAEPFRDGGWSESYHGRRLADTLYVQWRLLRREGLKIPAPVVAYIRGLHGVETCARRLDPEHDAFAEAVDDLGVVAAASRLRETLSVKRVRGMLEAAVPVLRELGARADRFGTSNGDDTTDSEPTRKPRRRQWSEVAGLVMLMLATVVAAQGLRAAGIGEGWVGASATALFVGLALVTLWRIWRHWG